MFVKSCSKLYSFFTVIPVLFYDLYLIEEDYLPYRAGKNKGFWNIPENLAPKGCFLKKEMIRHVLFSHFDIILIFSLIGSDDEFIIQMMCLTMKMVFRLFPF